LIAQDAESVVPEIVVTDPQGWKSVQYSKLIPVLIEAMKEQQDQMRSLKQLHAVNSDLRGRVHALELLRSRSP
jgi:glutamine synthetase adenylyltransferase